MTQYTNTYGTVYSVRDYKGEPRIMCREKASCDWLISGTLAVEAAAANTIEGLQQVLDNHARTHGWQPLEGPASAEPPEIVDECSDLDLPYPGDVYRSAKGGQLYKIGELTNGKKTCYLTMRCNVQGGIWVPANSSVYPNLSDAQGEFEAWIRREQLEPVAPTMDAAAIMDELAAKDPFKVGETSTVSPENSLDVSSCPSAEPARQAPAALPLSAPDTAPMSLPAFDYTGLDADTSEHLQNLARRAAQVNQRYILDLMEIVVEAHRELVQRLDKRSNQYSDSTFVSWCASIGVGRSTAYNLLQVQALMDCSTPEEQEVLADAPAKLLYATAKPSAPAELVQAVKDGDITSHKQYQDALAEIRARDAKITDLLDMSEAADRRADKAEQAAKDTARERDAALRRAAEAENRAAGAQKLADQRGDENASLKAQIRDLESRPVEVAVAQPGEEQIEAWRKEGENRAAAALQDSIRKADQAKTDAQRQVTDLQNQLSAARPDADACQRTADILYETAENLRILLRTQLKQAQLSPTAYGKVVAHVLQVARTLLDTVRVCSPDGYDMDSEEDDDFE